ncbi:Short-chain dehydrogenase reductase 3c [Geodia barretti]|uniref:Short-chain dehydrogenase reductase 3c n=1 Tax=Geodia barretti TaxID=519541 RepID=A0AA35RJ97_GEOBA|nr:Short-chain dehydrogenase reductase 3c [Geodia barretti]
MPRLEGKVAVITGATGGIGSAAARLFAGEGAKVALVDLDETALSAVARSIGDDKASYTVADVTQPDQTQVYVNAAVSRLGCIRRGRKRAKILLANAGIEGTLSPITDYLNWNIPSTCSTGLWRSMFVGSGWESSISGSPEMSAYNTSKHAVIGLMRTAALEGAPDRIRVNTVNPSPIETRMMRSIEEMRVAAFDDSTVTVDVAKQSFADRIPLQRYETRGSGKNDAVPLQRRQQFLHRGHLEHSAGVGGEIMATSVDNRIKVGSLEQLKERGCMVVTGAGHAIAVFHHDGRTYAVDNRCPHMGFPLDRGSVSDGILTCHWHHARFDLSSGGTFNPFADDVRGFPVEVIDGEVWIDPDPAPRDEGQHWRRRLEDGLEHNIRLVIAKSVLGLQAAATDYREPLGIGARFGTTYSANGWEAAMSILTCTANILPHLHDDDRPRPIYQGLRHVARECAGKAPRFAVEPLPTGETRPEVFARWFRTFIDVRDDEGAERCLITAIELGCSKQDIAGMVFAAATDPSISTPDTLSISPIKLLNCWITWAGKWPVKFCPASRTVWPGLDAARN